MLLVRVFALLKLNAPAFLVPSKKVSDVCVTGRV